MTRACFLRALAALALAVSSLAFGEDYPSRPIHFVVPYPAGSRCSTPSRACSGQKVSERLKQPVVVEDKPGAGGNIGADLVAKSPPEGYTILMGAVATHAINPTLYTHIPYDPVRDFAPITQVASTPNVLVVNRRSPYRTCASSSPMPRRIRGSSTSSSGSTA